MHIRTLARALPVLLAALAACTDPTTALRDGEAARSLANATPTGRVVVVFRDSTAIPPGGTELVASLGGSVTTRLDGAGVLFASGLSPAALEALRASALVSDVGPDYTLNWLPRLRVGGTIAQDGIGVANDDPTKARAFERDQWNMRVIQADRAWKAGYFGSPAVRVAILDTGIDYENRELKGLVELSTSKSFIGAPEPILPGDHEVMDAHFHGTHVASSVVTNNISIAGVAPHVRLIGVKVLSFLGSGTFEGVSAGIAYAADRDADIINMSLGAELDPSEEGVGALVKALRRTIRYAERQGTLVISAAGNSGLNLDDPASPIAVPCEVSTVCVSATGPVLQQNFDQPAFYTNYGLSAITVAAPGGNADPVNGNDVNQDLILGACSRRAQSPPLQVCATSNDQRYFYVYAAGTSMATPHVAGVAAMIKTHRPDLTVSQLKRRLTDSADDIGAPGRDVYSNWGRVNVFRGITGS